MAEGTVTEAVKKKNVCYLSRADRHTGCVWACDKQYVGKKHLSLDTAETSRCSRTTLRKAAASMLAHIMSDFWSAGLHC